MVTDCPFTVAEVVLMIAAELLGVVPPLLPVLVELALPQATAISATRSILIPKNARLKESICNILLANQNQRLVLNIIIYARRLRYLSTSNKQQCKGQSPLPGWKTKQLGIWSLARLNQECRGRSPLPGRGGYQLNQECRGRSPLPGFGVSPKNSFSLFCRRRRQKKKHAQQVSTINPYIYLHQ